MSDIAIRVENLSKLYQIGKLQQRHDTLRDALMAGLRKPFERLLGRNGRGPSRSIEDTLWGLKGMSNGPQRYLSRQLGTSDTIWALKDVSFEVQRGEVVGIIGRNGAGKSTLLKILSRITEPTEGRAILKGRAGSLLEVGTGFHPELTGRENVYLSGAIIGMRKAEIDRKFDEIVAFAEMEKFLDTPVKHYSSGMYVRLAFAVTAHLEPDILLVDEVLAVGDAAFQKKCLGKMGSVVREGRTVLFVSHNMAAIESLCVKTIVLSEGGLVFYGDNANAISGYFNQQNDVSPLVELAPYRSRSSVPILKNLRLTDEEGVAATHFPIGSTIGLELALDSKELAREPHLLIAVNNAYGARICTVSTRFQGVALNPIQGGAHIRAVLRDVMLAPGQYYVKVCFGDSVRDFDVVDGIPAFEIRASDYWGSGRLPAAAQGVVIQDVSWSSW